MSPEIADPVDRARFGRCPGVFGPAVSPVAGT
jgi:hypothetical protein